MQIPHMQIFQYLRGRLKTNLYFLSPGGVCVLPVTVSKLNGSMMSIRETNLLVIPSVLKCSFVRAYERPCRVDLYAVLLCIVKEI